MSQEITLWRKGEKSRKSTTASPHLPSHLVSAETGFPQGAAQNGPPSQTHSNSEEQSISPSEENITSNLEESQAPIEGMTREEGDGEGDKEPSTDIVEKSESN